MADAADAAHREAARAVTSNVRMATTLSTLSRLSGLKLCPVCGLTVSLMSKCKKQPSSYHVDLIR